MFDIDKQTLKDLCIYPASKGSDSLLCVLDEVSSYGGKYLLQRMLEYPLSTAREIGERVEFMKYIEARECELELDADDLSLGYSHFYSEVKRIKYVAGKVSSGKRYLVIFDELFRGTNVKDAYEATVVIITSFARVPTSLFLFSSHLIEAAEPLKEQIPGIGFHYFRTDLSGKELTYSYKLMEGIPDDRFGMYIIRREGIEEMLKQ